MRLTRVSQRSSLDNIYHCCSQQTASRWLSTLLADREVYRHCGLTRYEPRQRVFPRKAIISPLFVDFATFASIPKPPEYRAFYVTRDPRDVLVSWYLSSKYATDPMGGVGERRAWLHRLDQRDGLLYMIDFLRDLGVFEAQVSWARAQARDHRVLLLRFEEITAEDNSDSLEHLLRHLGIRIPSALLVRLSERHSFRRSADADPRQAERSTHVRRGSFGGWKSYFDDRIASRFEAVAGDQLGRLGYA